MKNEHLIKQFMEENGIEFNKPFYVDFGEEQEVFNIDNFKKYTILQNDDYIYFEDDTGEDISYEKMGKIMFDDEVHVISKDYFKKMMNYYISISKLCDSFYNNGSECRRCPVCSDSDGCFFTDSYAKNGIIEHLNSSYICFMPKDYKYKNKLLCKYNNYKELVDDVD